MNSIVNREVDLQLTTEAQRQIGEMTDRVNLHVFRELSSTNTEGKLAAQRGEAEGYVVIAEKQTGGYGRQQRRFFSPEATGLYMSLLLRPQMTPESALLITTAAATAAAEAIEALSGRDAHIKWVNDIFLDNRKVCGILAEAGLSSADHGLDYVVLGVGINLAQPAEGFPEEIRDTAASVFDTVSSNTKNRMAAEFLKRFFFYYDRLPEKTFFRAYKNRLMMLGHRIRVIKTNLTVEAKAVDVDEDFRLIVEYDNGEREALSSGEVSTSVC